MNLKQISDQLNLHLLTNQSGFDEMPVESAYTSDLLSCVMAGAKPACVWVTLQAHMNVIAVATLLEISAVIITEGAMPDQAVLQKANEQGVILFSSPETSYTVCGRLWEMGVRAS